MEDERITLTLEKIEPVGDYFPISFKKCQSLLFQISLRDDIARAYERQVSEAILEANPAWVLETISAAAAYGLTFVYCQKYGTLGALNYHAGQPPWARDRRSFKFYLDVQPDFLRIKPPPEIRLDLAKSILNLVDTYENILDLARDFDAGASKISKKITDAIFGLER